jgi:hypothetical protein
MPTILIVGIFICYNSFSFKYLSVLSAITILNLNLSPNTLA